ncbi:MAG: MBL fold metallo-hydrolase [Chitinophagaceae bacterium]
MIHIESFRFENYNENTYVMYGKNRDCFIVDPGCYEYDEIERIVHYIENSDLNPVGILVTHAHIDHIFGVTPLSELFKVKVYIQEKEYKVLLNMPKIGEGLGYRIDLFKGGHVFLNEDDTVKLDDNIVKVLFTPGHTQNSISFYNDKSHLLISGDVLFRNKIGKVTLPGGDYDTLIKTITEKLFVLPEHTIVYPGHGQPTTIGHEKENNKMEIWN